MALSLLYPLLLATFLFMQTLADTSFVQSRAAFYPNSQENGTDGKKITDKKITKCKHEMRFC